MLPCNLLLSTYRSLSQHIPFGASGPRPVILIQLSDSQELLSTEDTETVVGHSQE